ncbi:hypothetical protein ACIA8E_39780 [Streptomyces sp. NPDC051664]|uniref:hypothetical protein n=1 Tax=Streptomyces sp. NPDC051664 TaxID=3365668 RepID=UPI0037A1753C
MGDLDSGVNVDVGGVRDHTAAQRAAVPVNLLGQGVEDARRLGRSGWTGWWPGVEAVVLA